MFSVFQTEQGDSKYKNSEILIKNDVIHCSLFCVCFADLRIAWAVFQTYTCKVQLNTAQTEDAYGKPVVSAVNWGMLLLIYHILF